MKTIHRENPCNYVKKVKKRVACNSKTSSPVISFANSLFQQSASKPIFISFNEWMVVELELVTELSPVNKKK